MTLWHAAAPLLAGLGVAEYLAARRRGIRAFTDLDTIANLGCAVLSQVTGIGVAAVTIAAYHLTTQWFATRGLPPALPWQDTGWIGWGLVFLIVDLGQYLIHRLSHRVSILWACHEVHHSSGELNYAVAIRNSSLHGLLIWVFYLPGAALGIPWTMVATCYGINVLYQFLLHTRVVGRLGPLESWLNTPSHHRVHHGRQAKYLDRNFGGVLIVWDRVFGTFQREEEEPGYGPPLGSWNPVWANLHGLARIRLAWRAAGDWPGRWLAVFGPPERLPGIAPRASGGFRPSPALLLWVSLQTAAAVVATLLVVLSPAAGPAWRCAAAIGTIATIATGGALLDGERRASRWEAARVLLVAAVAIGIAAGT